ncbi:MAG: hypothetical protein HGA49_09105 [Eubacteriaceae bacterium]|nr:hypothetical protein [Eubacteriaceae bacterium]
MKNRKTQGSTYIEIIIAILIIGLTSLAFLGSLAFILEALRVAELRYETVQNADETMDRAVYELSLLGREQVTDELSRVIEDKYTSESLKTTISSQNCAEGLYLVKVSMNINGFKEADLLQTQVYLK